jgi:teichuronic acid biosynthesis glycosyltransferase TuaG
MSTNHSVTVSILLPFYNEEDCLHEAIEGIIGQTFRDWELLLLNDCSTDKSREMALEYSKSDNRICLIDSVLNLGQVGALNLGMGYAKGEFLAFCDADDVWMEKKLELQLGLFRRKEVGMVCGLSRYRRIGSSWRSSATPRYGQITYQRLLWGNCIGFSTLVVRREISIPLFEVLGPGIVHQDYIFILRLLQQNSSAIVEEVPEVVAEIGLRKGISSNKFRAMKSQWLILRQVANLSFIGTGLRFFYYLGFVFYKRGMGTIIKMLRV